MSALLYARVSTDRQAEHDLSIPAQFRILKEHAARAGTAVAGIYSDVASGRSMLGRPQLKELVLRCKRERDIDAVLVHRVDRLSRNLFEYLSLKARLKKYGVAIVSALEPVEDSPVGQLIENIMAAHAEYYSANLAQEVKKGLEERLRRGAWNAKPPIGYLRQADGAIVLDPARAPRVKMLFDRWASGSVTCTELADEVWRAGLVSATGRKFSGPNICRILHNPFYTGLMKTTFGIFPGKHEPLVSEELFAAACARFAQKKSAPRHTRHYFQLARRLICGVCGQSLIGDQTKKKSGRVYRYYRCHRTLCQNFHRADFLENQFVEGGLPSVNAPAQIMPRPRTESTCLAQNKDIIRPTPRIQN